MTPTASPDALRQAYADLAAGAPGLPERRAAAEALAACSGAALDWMNVAFERFSGFDFGAGHEALEHTLDLDPGFLPARWLQMQFPDELVARSGPAIAAFCSRWERTLAAFERPDPRDPAVQPHLWGCLGSATAFYRHYHTVDPALLRRYGRLVHRMMAALDPGEPLRPLRAGRRRVVFCSPHFYEHTVARLFLPLIEALDRRRFDVHCLHFGAENDAITQRARAMGNFHAGALAPPQWRQLIARLQADIIVYLDLGMHPLPQALAALRLAPRQAMLWGHPVSTGLPTLDAVLSPDAMEPADAAAHYSERLVRLPGLGNGLDPTGSRIAPPAVNATDLFCGQSIYKLHPGHDRLFARVLAEAPGARLHLIPHQDAGVREALLDRLRPVFADEGVDAAARVVMHGYGSLERYRALATTCALNLDSIGWSGGMSSLDLLGLGLPTVTLPGDTMRSRQTAAVLRTLGVPELVVDSEDRYVALALELLRDATRRESLTRRLQDALPRLDQRAAVVAALEDFLGRP